MALDGVSCVCQSDSGPPVHGKGLVGGHLGEGERWGGERGGRAVVSSASSVC